MTNPQYQVNIVWRPSHVVGQQLVNIGGVTQSQIVQGVGVFEASMPEIGIFATATDYRTALDNVLAIATASSFVNPGITPYSQIRHW
jgi:hypothetical protein